MHDHEAEWTLFCHKWSLAHRLRKPRSWTSLKPVNWHLICTFNTDALKYAQISSDSDLYNELLSPPIDLCINRLIHTLQPSSFCTGLFLKTPLNSSFTSAASSRCWSLKSRLTAANGKSQLLLVLLGQSELRWLLAAGILLLPPNALNGRPRQKCIHFSRDFFFYCHCTSLRCRCIALHWGWWMSFTSCIYLCMSESMEPFRHLKLQSRVNGGILVKKKI